MKIKCVDGKVRNFKVATVDGWCGLLTEARCLECGELFGVSDTKILKPKFREHICKDRKDSQKHL